jgi:hypothetical protein
VLHLQSHNTGLTKTKEKKLKVSKEEEKLPASLRRMLELKAAAAGGSSVKKKHLHSNTATNKAGPDATCSEGKGSERKSHAQPRARANASVNGSNANLVEKHKSLPERKKLFLQQKKLRKKGRSVGIKDEGDQLLYTNESKVNFGVVANQPLQANLKRRHWSEAEAANNVDSWRPAKKSENPNSGRNGVRNVGNIISSKEAVDEYRLRRKNTSGNGATMQSLKELVRQGAHA